MLMRQGSGVSVGSMFAGGQAHETAPTAKTSARQRSICGDRIHKAKGSNRLDALALCHRRDVLHHSDDKTGNGRVASDDRLDSWSGG